MKLIYLQIYWELFILIQVWALIPSLKRKRFSPNIHSLNKIFYNYFNRDLHQHLKLQQRVWINTIGYFTKRIRLQLKVNLLETLQHVGSYGTIPNSNKALNFQLLRSSTGDIVLRSGVIHPLWESQWQPVVPAAVTHFELNSTSKCCHQHNTHQAIDRAVFNISLCLCLCCVLYHEIVRSRVEFSR